MKNVFSCLMVLALLVCTSFAQSGPAAKGMNKSGKASGGASASSLQDTLATKEKVFWEAFKNKNSKPFEENIAEDSIEVTANGPVDRAGTIKGVTDPGCSLKSVSLSDFKLTKVDADAALLTYKGTADGACGGQKFAPVYGSTLWVKRGGKWMALFHQETNVQKE